MKTFIFLVLFAPIYSFAGDCAITLPCPGGTSVSCSAWNGIAHCERIREGRMIGVACAAGFSSRVVWCPEPSNNSNRRDNSRSRR